MPRKEINMTTGSPLNRMTAFALPVIAGGLVQQLYFIADSVIAGRLIGSGALAAVSNASLCVYLLSVLFMGIGNGASILLSQFYGAGRLDEARVVVDTSLALIVAGGLICSALGLAISEPVLRILATPAEIMVDSLLYLRILFIGILPSFGYAVLSGLLNAVGDSRTPLKLLALSSIVNAFLDYALVAWLGMGTSGLAIATVTSQALAFVCCLLYLAFTNGAISIHLRGLRFEPAMLWKVTKLGLPTGVQDVLMMVSVMVLQNRINVFGVSVVAGRSIVGRIEGFLLLPIHGLGAAVTIFTGQNSGAGKTERVRKGLIAGFTLMTGMSLALTAVILILSGHIFNVFTSDAKTVAAASECIWITTPYYTFYALAVVWHGFFRGSGDTVFPLVVSLLTQFAFRIFTVDIFLGVWATPNGIWYAYAASWILMFALDTLYYRLGIWKRFAAKTAQIHACG